MAIEVYIIDDHPIINNGLTEVINHNNYGIRMVGSSTSCEDAYEQIEELQPEVVLLDIEMPVVNGVDCCKILKEKYPEMKVIAYTGQRDTGLLFDMWLEKPDAMLPKSSSIAEIVKTVMKVMEGRKIIDENLPEFFSSQKSKGDKKIQLTRIETKVLTHLAEGLTRSEVAEEMNRAKDTINFHCLNIFKKFDNHKMQEIIREAKKARYIK